MTTGTGAQQNLTVTGARGAVAATGCGGIVSASVGGAAVGIVPLAAGICTLTVSDAAGDTFAVPVTVTTTTLGGS